MYSYLFNTPLLEFNSGVPPNKNEEIICISNAQRTTKVLTCIKGDLQLGSHRCFHPKSPDHNPLQELTKDWKKGNGTVDGWLFLSFACEFRSAKTLAVVLKAHQYTYFMQHSYKHWTLPSCSSTKDREGDSHARDHALATIASLPLYLAFQHGNLFTHPSQ